MSNESENFPQGFEVSSVKSGLKNNDYDIALIVSNPYAQAVGMYTKHKFAAAPVLFSKKNDKNKIKALFINSKIANSGTGQEGYKNVINYVESLSKKLECESKNILVASTGIIGIQLDMDKITNSIDELVKDLKVHPNNAPRAICTSDKYEKCFSLKVEIDGKVGSFFAMAKGNSSIHPNMATVLLFIFTDINIDRNTLKQSFNSVINKTLNRISIDNDTSTNDSAIIMANGAIENKIITVKTKKNYTTFTNALETICENIAKMIVKDGEGTIKIAAVYVKSAKTPKMAFDIAKSIAISTMVKISLNINKIDTIKLIAIASETSSQFDPDIVRVKINDFLACDKAKIIDNSENKEFLKSMKLNEYKIEINCGFKTKFDDYYIFSDLTHEYISFNNAYNI